MLSLMISTHAFAQPVRIAVAGDPSLANLVDITTAEFSKSTQLAVLDRASLDKLGQEQQLQSMLDARDFSAYWPKLASIQQDKIDALSLLGLRFEVDSPDTREWERTINLFLASRLSAEPDVVVLERWRLNDAVFEKSLSAQSAPFWTGSSLIDGSMRMNGGQIEVTLRVRPPQGQEVSISDKDTPANLPALVERLANKINEHPANQSPWNPANEAQHFAQLGQWCLDNDLYEESIEAYQSATALGDSLLCVRKLVCFPVVSFSKYHILPRLKIR